MTLVKLFNKLFGEKHFSWKCFWRSSTASSVVSLIVLIGAEILSIPHALLFDALPSLSILTVGALVGNLLPDYLSLWKTRYLLNLSVKEGTLYFHICSLFTDILLSIPYAVCGLIMATVVGSMFLRFREELVPFLIPSLSANPNPRELRAMALLPLLPVLAVALIPALFGRLWLMLYVGSGLVLKAARNLDVGFAWFNRRFDVQDHPLQCIGLVAGAISALGYWLLASIRIVP